MIAGLRELLAQRACVRFGDARDQQTPIPLPDFQGNGCNLLGSFAFSENDLRKILPQRAVQIDFRKSKVCHGRGLKGVQDLLATNVARSKLFQQSDRFGRCHAPQSMP